jgi:anthranilate/para-aminobenzoate synthase component II
MILFLDNYDSFTYNLVDYIGQMEPDLLVIRNDQIDVAEITALNPQGILISQGPGTPDKAGISVRRFRFSACVWAFKQLDKSSEPRSSERLFRYMEKHH